MQHEDVSPAMELMKGLVVQETKMNIVTLLDLGDKEESQSPELLVRLT